jgi:hypothetical protein
MLVFGNNIPRDAHAELLRLCARIGYSPHRS